MYHSRNKGASSKYTAGLEQVYIIFYCIFTPQHPTRKGSSICGIVAYFSS